jgi:hypothetical protein
MKIRPGGAEVFHAGERTDEGTDGQRDGRTDRQTDRHDEANSSFSQFCKSA